MNEQEAKSKLEETCRKCAELKNNYDAIMPNIEERLNEKGKKIKGEQLELKKDYIKFLTNDNFVGYDKISSIHYCYTGCEHNINKEGEIK